MKYVAEIQYTKKSYIVWCKGQESYCSFCAISFQMWHNYHSIGAKTTDKIITSFHNKMQGQIVTCNNLQFHNNCQR